MRLLPKREKEIMVECLRERKKVKTNNVYRRGRVNSKGVRISVVKRKKRFPPFL